MLTEFKLCITAFILMILLCAAFSMRTAGKKPKDIDTLDGVLAVLLSVSGTVFVVSGLAGVWQL